MPLSLSGRAPSHDEDYDIPERFFHLYSGRASDGGLLRRDNPIRVVSDHPVVRGLPDVFSGGIGTEFFVRAVVPFDPDLQVLATYVGHGGIHPAIMTGPLGPPTTAGTAQAVLLFFDAMDNPTDPELLMLWINSIKWACVPQPNN